jgi:methylmalonyl-CoA mutase N-terminal domain/subunit
MVDSKKMKRIEEEKNRWEKNLLRPHISQHPESEDFVTVSGIPIKPLYTPLDIEHRGYENDLGFPGEFPFTRGVIPNMFRSRLWIMGQFAGYGSAKEANKRYRYLIEQGQNGFGIAFDLPSQLGYDSDHPLASGQVGQVGVAVCTLEDMEILLEGIPLDKVQIRVIANAPTAIILAMIVVESQKRGFPLKDLHLALQNDILKEYTARGNYIFPPGPSMRLFTDVLEYCTEYLPNSIPVYFCGYQMREAGANAIQEVAFTLGHAMAYVSAGIDRGLSPDAFGANLMFYFGCHRNFFEEVAKIRAARRLWAKIMKVKFGAKNPDACKLHLYATSSGATLTAQEPYNNIVRVTLQALAGVLGGAEVMHLASMDEALGIPTQESVRIAIRTQQIIAHESGAIDTADPLGGSYYVEHLTNRIEAEVENTIKKIEEVGGPIRAIEVGYTQREIMESAYRYQKEEEMGKRIVIGVNRFRPEQEVEPTVFRVDPGIEEDQKSRLKAFKTARDQQAVRKMLQTIRQVASGSENVMPALIEAVKAHVTVGEICDVLREIYGTYKEVKPF